MLSSLASILARTMIKHPLVLAVVLVVSGASWTIPASAADAPGAGITNDSNVQ